MNPLHLVYQSHCSYIKLLITKHKNKQKKYKIGHECSRAHLKTEVST